MSDTIFSEKPLSKIHSIAEHYWFDSKDFITRFDLTLTEDISKTGRIKRFVDLLMAGECALKCHIALGSKANDPNEVYRKLKRCGHDIKKLAALSNYLEDKSIYNSLSDKLGEFNIFIRYSLDAYDYFFPFNIDQTKKKNKAAWDRYSDKVSNDKWTSEVKEEINQLNSSVTLEFNGFISTDMQAILDSEFKPQMPAAPRNNTQPVTCDSSAQPGEMLS